MRFSYFGSPHSSGLGFGLGAVLGELARPEAMVIAAVGDGAYFFGEPLSCLFVRRAHQLLVLTVVFNDQQWEAVTSGALAVHPDGVAQTCGRVQLRELCDKPRSPSRRTSRRADAGPAQVLGAVAMHARGLGAPMTVEPARAASRALKTYWMPSRWDPGTMPG